MFYPTSLIDECFKCQYCQTKFTSVVKLIPDCGHSICIDCYDDLWDSLDESNRFNCKACHQDHTMSSTGFLDNKCVMSFCKVQPVEKIISDEAKTLRQSLKEAADKIDEIKTFDTKSAINNYCDQLQSQVMDMVDSAVKYINIQGGLLIKEINDYRQDLLLNSESLDTSDLSNVDKPESSETRSLFRKLSEISNEVDLINNSWSKYFNQMDVLAKDVDVQSTQRRVNEVKEKLAELREDMFRSFFKQTM